MQCSSCGAKNNDSGSCIECGQPGTFSFDDSLETTSVVQPHPKKSTLIEFPGINRNSVPEWRKELSVRVREVQERRAREAAREAARQAAREAAEAERRRLEAAANPPQLELLPQAEAPPMNPLVAAALRRIERAHKVASEDSVPRARVATAVAYAPTLETHDEIPDIQETSTTLETQLTPIEEHTCEETQPKLVAVPINPNPVTTKVEKPSIPKRLIVDDPNDPALNYLDSIDRTLRVDEVSNHRASAFRRLVSSLFDLLTCAVLVSPIALALYSNGVDLTAVRPLTVIIGAAVLLMFLYFTLSIALTGRTWAMKLFSMRVIDIRTGLIPTGSQSAGRAFFYLVSLAIAGLGILYALISRDGDAMHDRFTRTAVIKI